MRIGIDLQVLSNQRTGIGNYAFNLARELLKIKTGHEFVLFFSNSVILNEVKNLARSFGLRAQDDKFILLPDKQIPFWSSHIIYARIMEKAKLDVLHGVANTVPLGFKGGNGGKGNKGTRCVITFHDLAIYRHPEWFVRQTGLRRGEWFSKYVSVPQSIKKAQKIIVPSEATKKDLMELFRVPEEKVAVIAHGVEERFFKSQERPLPSSLPTLGEGKRGYILFVGTLEPRKNITRLIEAYQGLPEGTKKDFDLLLVGKKSDSSPALPRPGEGVRWLDYVTDEDLPGLYQNAALFVYPSLYEGFGLPVLEAMAAGVPVVTSSQVAGNTEYGISNMEPHSTFHIPHSILVDPYSVEEIREAMERLLADAELRGEMGEKGVMLAKRFSWGQTVQKTLEIYESV